MARFPRFNFKAILWLGVIASIVLGYNALKQIFTTKSTPSQTANLISSRPRIQEKLSSQQLTTSGWIPDWATKMGEESLKNNPQSLDNISPVWYEVEEDGTLKDNTPSNSKIILELAKAQKIEVTPTIALFDHKILSKVLNSPQNLNRHVDSIYQMVVENNFHGVDLDYESTYLEDKELFFEMLTKLSQKLKQDEKRLIFTVLPKWGDAIQYPAFKETRQVQDWTKLGELCDEIRIMTYDYTGGRNRNPGPIAPLEWQEDIIKYGITKVDKSKLVLGVHLYSYEWFVPAKAGASDTDFSHPNLEFKQFWWNNTSSPTTARSYSYQTVSKILNDYPGVKESYQNEEIYKYTKVNDTTGIREHRVIVYIDKAGVQARVDLAKRYGLRGVGYWRIGGEQDLISSLSMS